MPDDEDHNHNEDDAAFLWNYVTRDVKPLKKDDIERDAVPPKKRTKRAAGKKQVPVEAEPRGPAEKAPQGREIDRRTAGRLKRGGLPIDGRIDLHGLTQAQAHEQLNHFIQAAYGAGKRCLLVITGKGRRSGTEEKGVLRRKVPEWLDSPPLRAIVLQYTQAQAKDGGSGALYVYLRRQRNI